MRHIEANVEEERFVLRPFAEEDASLLPGTLEEACVGLQKVARALAENLRLRVGGGVVENRLRGFRVEAEVAEAVAIVVIEVPVPEPRRVVFAEVGGGVTVPLEHHRQGSGPLLRREGAAAVPADRMPPLPLPGKQARAVRQARRRGDKRVLKQDALRASRSMFGVLISGCPAEPSSSNRWSSARMKTMLGFCSAASAACGADSSSTSSSVAQEGERVFHGNRPTSD